MLHHPAEMRHYTTELLIALAVLVVVVLAVRLVVGNPGAARHRVRVLRWRIRLYLRPGPGYANILELAVRWSRLRAVRIGRRSRPSLPWWARLLLPVTVLRGPAGPGALRAAGHRRAWRTRRWCVAAPRTGKSGWLADRIIDHPGAAVTTTTRTDLFENTAALRGQHGAAARVQPRGHRRPAIHLPVESAAGLRAARHRAAAGGVVHRRHRVQGPARHGVLDRQGLIGAREPAARGSAGWPHHDTTSTSGRTASTTPSPSRSSPPTRRGQRLARPDPGDPQARPDSRLDPHDRDPRAGLARRPGRRGSNLARPGRGVRRRRVRVRANTLYMIGTGREEAPIAPLFRAFAEYVHAGAAFTGSLQPHGRLDPPLLMALDEVTQICPVPLPLWMADSAGKGHPDRGRLPRPGPARSPLGQVRRPGDLGHRRHQGHPRRRQRPRHPRPAVPAVRRGRAAHARPDPGSRTDGAPAPSLTSTSACCRPNCCGPCPNGARWSCATNLSPVIVRLRMAWRRRDYRRARRMDMAPEQRIPVVRGGSARISDPSIPTRRNCNRGHADELAAPRTDPRPQSAPHGKDAKDAPPLPPSLGEDTVPPPPSALGRAHRFRER